MVYCDMQEYKMHNTDILFKEDATVDDLIDVIEGNRRYVKCLYVYNKIDVCSIEEVDEIARQPNSIPASAGLDLNMDGLLAAIWEKMALVRVYTKKVTMMSPRSAAEHASLGLVIYIEQLCHVQVGGKPDFSEPVVLSADRGGTTVEHLCDQIHRSLAANLNYALVWGTSSKHYPQR